MPRIRWTLEEDERLLGLIAAGKSWTFISAALRRDTNAVKLHARTLQKRAARLLELEEIGAKLLATARKLPPGADRHNILQEIGRFRAQIAALQGPGLPVRRGQKAKGKRDPA
jgi:hypothetical protein